VLLEAGAEVGQDPVDVIGQARIVQRSQVDALEGQVPGHEVRSDRGVPLLDDRRSG